MKSTITAIDLATDVAIGVEDKLTALAMDLLPRIRVGDEVSDALLCIYVAIFQARQLLQDTRIHVVFGRAEV